MGRPTRTTLRSASSVVRRQNRPRLAQPSTLGQPLGRGDSTVDGAMRGWSGPRCRGLRKVPGTTEALSVPGTFRSLLGRVPGTFRRWTARCVGGRGPGAGDRGRSPAPPKRGRPSDRRQSGQGCPRSRGGGAVAGLPNGARIALGRSLVIPAMGRRVVKPGAGEGDERVARTSVGWAGAGVGR